MNLYQYYKKLTDNFVIASVIIAAISCISYSNIFANEYVYDDIHYIVQWSEVGSRLSGYQVQGWSRYENQSKEGSGGYTSTQHTPATKPSKEYK